VEHARLCETLLDFLEAQRLRQRVEYRLFQAVLSDLQTVQAPDRALPVVVQASVSRRFAFPARDRHE
jgi:hypothetical protein